MEEEEHLCPSQAFIPDKCNVLQLWQRTELFSRYVDMNLKIPSNCHFRFISYKTIWMKTEDWLPCIPVLHDFWRESSKFWLAPSCRFLCSTKGKESSILPDQFNISTRKMRTRNLILKPEFRKKGNAYLNDLPTPRKSWCPWRSGSFLVLVGLLL